MKYILIAIACLAITGCAVQDEFSQWLEAASTIEQMVSGVIFLQLVTIVFILGMIYDNEYRRS